jgi:hypothetical protein
MLGRRHYRFSGVASVTTPPCSDAPKRAREHGQFQNDKAAPRGRLESAEGL